LLSVVVALAVVAVAGSCLFAHLQGCRTQQTNKQPTTTNNDQQRPTKQITGNNDASFDGLSF